VSILKNSSDEDLINAIIENYYVTTLKIVENFGFPNPKELFNINGYISGIHYMMLNALFDGYDNISSEDVKKVISYFKENKIPMMWFVSPIGINQGLDKLLEGENLELAKMEVPGMSKDLSFIDIEEFKSIAAAHDVREVDSDLMENYTEIFLQAFEIDISLKDDFSKFTKNFISYPDSKHYIAIWNDQPVSIASVLYECGVAGVYNVATIPSARKKGIANSIMAKCLLDSVEKGYQYSILHSTAKGRSIYLKLGYEEKFIFNRYLLRPTVVGL
jgi:hypothetical protein